ncbi:acetyl-CoA carboxylase biotin carboxyl carrier protein [Candidatus Cytomitobacter indipagum]|uniref:Biotin carboxyl carrier protein of acetyl-CoA carboxylase n=1 Tax=Candidatus Cytomitobacter indipagum TaxID=2601575 RepID=A0A5C0UEI7_9PROT|nr:acetyl-CoA carboxylase biotin carboxyl carrier protein [Candidatus Cytomitobacter indipagum]QEK38063.1 acetyl-CoA carboxylase biotin carboxyl carrier protein [Candidatus Cytomitobacter indipagum]
MTEFNKEYIEYLVSLVKENELGEIEYTKSKDGEVRVTVKNQKSENNIATQPQVIYSNPMIGANSEAQDNQNSSNQSNNISNKLGDNFKPIKSPMIGTIYTSPKPGDPPFVKKGSKINEGDILFIVEAMKVMNEVKASFSGTIEEILISDADPVEFDQILAKVS